jgi:predicted phosphoadenosine phosphosulfate sulfurtransferase
MKEDDLKKPLTEMQDLSNENDNIFPNNVDFPLDVKANKLTPYYTSNFLGKFFFNWTRYAMKTANKAPLKILDFKGLAERDQSQNLLKPLYEKWYSEKYNSSMCGHFVGIRCDESLNRFRTIVSMKKDRFKDKPWTTRDKPLEHTYSIYPIYDWRTEDDWIATFKYNLEYNYVYELMYKNGLGIHQQRLCQPFGDDQKNGLDQYKAIEAENWEKLLKRVAGVNFGNIYCRTSALGNIKSEKPAHLTWQEWALYLLESIGIYNKKLEKHYATKIRKFFKYWEEKCGCTLDMVEDEADKKMESLKIVPSWRRVARALERNDFFLTRLSFGETKSDLQYLKDMIYGCNNLYDENSTDSKPLKRLYKKAKEEMENEKNGNDK